MMCVEESVADPVVCVGVAPATLYAVQEQASADRQVTRTILHTAHETLKKDTKRWERRRGMSWSKRSDMVRHATVLSTPTVYANAFSFNAFLSVCLCSTVFSSDVDPDCTCIFKLCEHFRCGVPETGAIRSIRFVHPRCIRVFCVWTAS